MTNHNPDLKPNLTPGARVEELAPGCWRLVIPAGPKGRYRLAQLDDYRGLARRAFPWHPPLRVVLRARVSAPDLPGTWGFGLWNDPFSFSLGLSGASRRFPALPNAAWFFFASPPNYLSFRNDLPAQGFLAATFRSPHLPAPLLALGSPVMALGVVPLAAQLLRLLLRKFIRQDAALVATNVTAWHTYAVEWQLGQVSLNVDGQDVLVTPVAPHAPLSLVLWVDNQYAALPPRGILSYGCLANPEPAWMEVELGQIE
ncbi:MAG: hypothetical protein JW726_18855 [Anaerolineales bacterium]|nr:hypothetical protein [Anaerolineales bacterium]